MFITFLIVCVLVLIVCSIVLVHTDKELIPFALVVMCGACALTGLAGMVGQAQGTLDKMTDAYIGNKVIYYDSTGTMHFTDSTSYEFKLYEHVQGMAE